MVHVDVEYMRLVRRILEEGKVREDRTGTGTLGVFGGQIRVDLAEGFPLLTTKRVPFRVMVNELRWFISGSTNLKPLLDSNVNIWNADAYRWYKQKNPSSLLTMGEFLDEIRNSVEEEPALGDLGDIYAKQWRRWTTDNGEEVDQIQNVIASIRNDPYGRRHLVTAWNPGDLSKGNTALPPCHYGFEFYVSEGKLSCCFSMRSSDVFLGLPLNIASYALLTHLIAKMTGLKVGELIYTGGDIHLYLNLIEQAKLQLTREPRPLPKLNIKTIHNRIEDYTMDDIELVGYDPHPVIKGDVSVGK